MLNRLGPVLMAPLALAPPSAVADIRSASSDGFEIVCLAQSATSSREAWTRLVHVERWWSSAHTYSGDAANLRLTPKAGGAWIERWSGGEVEHGRVVAILPRTLLRVHASLGPLQEIGVVGVLNMALEPVDTGGVKVTFTYRVSGSSAQALDRIAGPVNDVICEQARRFAGVGAP